RRAAGGDDVLVFLERTTPGPARRAVREALEERIGTGVSAATRDSAAGGERPLLRVPAEAGARVVELLEAQGLPARTESRTGSWRAQVPAPIGVLAGVVGVGGRAGSGRARATSRRVRCAARSLGGRAAGVARCAQPLRARPRSPDAAVARGERCAEQLAGGCRAGGRVGTAR